MIPYILDRPALGQVTPLGSLYDARSDTFIPLSLFKNTLPEGAVETTKANSTKTRYSETDAFKQKFEAFGVNAELGASFLAGLVKVDGSGCYLSETRNSDLVMQSSMHYSITTVNETLNLTASGLKDCLAFDFLDHDCATHVVTGITWGASCVIAAKRQVLMSEDRRQIASEMEAQFSCLKSVDVNREAKSDITCDSHGRSTDQSVKIAIYSDVIADDGEPPDSTSAETFMRNMPKYIASTNDGKGKPLIYTLMPLSMLAMLRIIDIKADITLHPLDASEIVHRAQYADALKDVRSGRADIKQLEDFLERMCNEATSAQRVKSIASFGDKMDFVDLVTGEGARYVGYKSQSLHNLLMENEHDDAYIMCFNEELRDHSETWNETMKVLLELLRSGSQDKLIVVVDCDATHEPLEKVYISQMRRRRVIIEDVIEQRKTLESSCVMKYRRLALDRTMTSKPLQRRAVKIPCPQRSCDRTLLPSWICSVCCSMVEYGHVDDFLYCDCGACPYDQWEHQCKNPKHGSSWAKHDSQDLLELLQQLEPFEELNILILGETGVGKSTWINAFINYLTHMSLEEALDADALKWVIPCHFQTQMLEQGRFIQKKVSIGTSNGESDGSSGQSATQETSVYTIDIGNTRVRLIDTPGIGDTRGVDQDNKNMVDILKVLRSYSKLHGILILLKPNAPRLTTLFRFCVKQLLTHLHRNAANNIVFGFTNTRGSNFKPGDTFRPLEKLLGEYKESKMGLYEHNVYCFDSESFRFLAAHKKGIDMGFIEDNARSWEHSVAECKRLVSYFQGIQPHQVRNTLSLNETRNIITRLTEPMAIIAQKIASSIKVNEDQIEELNKRKLTRAELEQKLFVQKDSVESYEVDMPRTVCTHSSCVELRSGFNGRDETTIIYKTMCHKPCYLSGVPLRKKGDPNLQNCGAMDSEGMCLCGHNWMDHMHICYDYREVTSRYQDEAVAKDLTANATDIEVKEEAIKIKEIAIEEYKLEHAQVQEAGIQFGFFLKRHAITPYNDATLEYIDMLLDQENIKVSSGGRKQKWDALRKYRAEHVEKVKVLEEAMSRGESGQLLDDAGVRQLISTLYGLPHFGKDLEGIANTNERAAEATYREKTSNISAGAHWHRKSQSKSKGKEKQTYYGSNGTFSERRLYEEPQKGGYAEALPESSGQSLRVSLQSSNTSVHPRPQDANDPSLFGGLYKWSAIPMVSSIKRLFSS
ncbi:hypothetical protein G7Z17_g4243 [Cylindrodendrum hubeiense]|uniref:G domain-containing protein n=1 Tax=Cylindrodendrum hubeiense TaxID=595255 RepID=A0A9P5HGD4_9HYPO|nr:hypothetical protein G7Z17_g4243 [Cylindrodendrum hubeiense]